MKKKIDKSVAIVASQYRLEITKNLVKNCVDTLKKEGVAQESIKIYWVSGALEIPLTAKKLAKTGEFSAIIAFGAVLKGKTYHFEQVANECVRGCMNVSYEFEIPVVFEVLCVYEAEDAIERATGAKDNRGVEGALTALRMIKLLKGIK